MALFLVLRTCASRWSHNASPAGTSQNNNLKYKCIGQASQSGVPTDDQIYNSLDKTACAAQNGVWAGFQVCTLGTAYPPDVLADCDVPVDSGASLPGSSRTCK